MRKIALFLLISLMTIHLDARGVEIGRRDRFASQPKQLTGSIEKLYLLPEFHTLIESVQKEGRVRVTYEFIYDGDFDGFWDSSSRTIIVNANRFKSEGKALVTILFELHNAKSNQHFKHLVELAQKGQITKEAYVLAVEKMEYENCLMTCALLEKGRALGIFPKDATWNIAKTFEEHYRIQLRTGHSEWIAKAYDHFNPKSSHIPFRG
jgi:hypothetical protein